MSLKIENCTPISVVLTSDNVTLQAMKGLLPTAIDILAKYSYYSEEFETVFVYKVLMPYQFNSPNFENPFGDRCDTMVRMYGDKVLGVGEGTPVLAQDVVYIISYYH